MLGSAMHLHASCCSAAVHMRAVGLRRARHGGPRTGCRVCDNGMGKVHVKVIRTRGPVRVKFKPIMALHGSGEKTLGLNSRGKIPNRTPAENKGYVWA